MQEKRDQGTDGRGRQKGHPRIPDPIKEHAEERACQNTITRRKSVDAVDQIDRIDDAYRGEYRQRHGQPPGDFRDAPQTVKIIDTISSDENQQHDGDDFDHEPQGRRKIQDIVHRSGIEHGRHGCDHDQQVVAVYKRAHDPHADHDPEKYGHAAQHGDRRTLQFAGVGVIHNALQQGDLHQPGMNPRHHHQGGEKCDQNRVKR